ncbi:MAG: hypothetical protein E7083_00045 [Bacteroidales bacterium]|nr:hypothetical protein [Bacteroidales bacterium]
MKDKYLRIMLILTPAILRRGILICIYRAIAEAIKGLHERYENFKADVELKLSYSGQVYSLVKLIKDKTSILCEIIDMNESKAILLYRENDNGEVEQVILTEKDAEYLIYKEGVSELVGNGFAVIISKSDSEYVNKVCELIDKYKLAGKRYKVIYKD